MTCRFWPALLLVGCHKLPDYAAPKGGVVGASALDVGDVIGYRKLERSDFHGKRPPPEFAQAEKSLGAATCGQVRTSPDTLVLVHYQTGEGETRYWIEIKQLRFLALMDRRCSFWNDRVAAREPAYVLQHEQIHFALYELGARKLNAELPSIEQRMLAQGKSQAEVETHAQQALRDVLKHATDDMLEQNRAFDEDTSLGYRPDRQRAWLARVMRELAETEAFKSPPYVAK